MAISSHHKRTMWTGVKCPVCQTGNFYVRADDPGVTRCDFCGDSMDVPKRDVIGVDPLEGQGDGGPHEARLQTRTITPNLIDWTVGPNDRQSGAGPFLLEAHGVINQKRRELYLAMAKTDESEVRKLLISQGWMPPDQEHRGCTNATCRWEGKTNRMIGSIGPVCPNCGDTTEVITPQPIAVTAAMVRAAADVLGKQTHPWMNCIRDAIQAALDARGDHGR